MENRHVHTLGPNLKEDVDVVCIALFTSLFIIPSFNIYQEIFS